MQEKEITITNLSQRDISPKPGQTFRPFTVYQIQGNDGNTYETTEKSFYDTLSLGKVTKIKFQEVSKNVNGRIYTSFKIASDRPENPGIQKILTRIDEMEKNILNELKKSSPTPQKSSNIHEDIMEVSIDDEPQF